MNVPIIVGFNFLRGIVDGNYCGEIQGKNLTLFIILVDIMCG